MKLLREPLLHFAIAGTVLFSAYSWLDGHQAGAEAVEPVRVGQGEIEWLKKLHQNQWLRPPDTRELQGLVTDLVNEELLAREAEAMGLGEDDGIIRRRLAQKLKFLVEDTARIADPDDDALRSYFDETRSASRKVRACRSHRSISIPKAARMRRRDAAAALAALNAGAKKRNLAIASCLAPR